MMLDRLAWREIERERRRVDAEVARQRPMWERLARRHRAMVAAWERTLWRLRVLSRLDAARSTARRDGAEVRAWLAATWGEALSLPEEST